MLGNKYNVLLKASIQWDQCMGELSSALKSIIWSKGITIVYAIRVENAPKILGLTKWENKAIDGTPSSVVDYCQDRQLVHQIILKNIKEESCAYTYIKSHLKK